MSAGRLPDFLLVGAAKSGTTSLHEYLARHPRVFLATPKEPEFFSRDELYLKGLDEYRALFAEARPDQLCGEASTTYTRWPHTPDAAQRIAEALPAARLVYVMRHPVDRAYSHYAHHMRYGVTMSFEEALDRDSIYVDCGMYLAQIERYLRYFPREQFLFLLSTDLRNDPAGSLESVQKFLGLPTMDLVGSEPVQANPTTADHFIRSRTTARLRSVPGLSAVVDRLPQRVRDSLYGVVRRSPVGRALAARYRLDPMTAETRARLLAQYAQPNRDLERFLGRPLRGWDR